MVKAIHGKASKLSLEDIKVLLGDPSLSPLSEALSSLPVDSDPLDQIASGSPSDPALAPTHQVTNAFAMASAAANKPRPPEPQLSSDPRTYEIQCMLLSKWSDASIIEHFRSIPGSPSGLCPTEDELAVIRSELPTSPAQAIAPTYLDIRHPRTVRINPMESIHQLLSAMKERVGAAFLLDEIDGSPSRSANSVSSLYFDMLARTVELQQSLGSLPDLSQRSSPVAQGQLALGPGNGLGEQQRPIAIIFQQLVQQRAPAVRPAENREDSPPAPIRAARDDRHVVIEGGFTELDPEGEADGAD